MEKASNDSRSNLELLRESLAELERARNHERALRLETEALLAGIQILNEATDRQTFFERLAQVFSGLIPFQTACLLLQGKGGFKITRTTAPELLGTVWPTCPILERIEQGEAFRTCSPAALREWQDNAPEILNSRQSVMLSPIRSETMVAAMVCLHTDGGVFSETHMEMAKRFKPLVEQVLRSIEVQERLQRDHEEIQQATLDKLRALEELRKADEDIRQVRELMSGAISFAPIYLWEIDQDGCYSFVEGIEKVLGWTSEDMIGRDALQFAASTETVHTVSWKEYFSARHSVQNLVTERRHRDGRSVWLSVSGSPFTDKDGNFKGFRGVTTDVTESMLANQKLAEMALHDALTGLANRRKFLSFFDNEVARLERYRKPLSLLALDLDHFKQVNDEYGHPAGDDVLIAVANILKGMVRKTDLAARFGGEEFMILLPETDSSAAVNVAEKIRTTLEAEVISAQCGETRVLVPITVSIGVASVTPAARAVSFDDLIERADQALYAAKLNGRNQVFVEDDLNMLIGVPDDLD